MFQVGKATQHRSQGIQLHLQISTLLDQLHPVLIGTPPCQFQMINAPHVALALKGDGFPQGTAESSKSTRADFSSAFSSETCCKRKPRAASVRSSCCSFRTSAAISCCI
eukprot:Skav208568  [mRNA]  locus=scaffold177:140686:147341:- [translate_table: standard]